MGPSHDWLDGSGRDGLWKERGLRQAREQAVQRSRLRTVRTKHRETKGAGCLSEQECEAQVENNKNGYFLLSSD